MRCNVQVTVHVNDDGERTTIKGGITPQNFEVSSTYAKASTVQLPEGVINSNAATFQVTDDIGSAEDALFRYAVEGGTVRKKKR